MSKWPAVLAVVVLSGCHWIDWIDRPPTPTSCPGVPCPEGFVCTERGLCVPEAPEPSPTAGPVPSPSPKPSPSPSSTPVPPSPVPSPEPCASKPLCVTKDGQPASDCVSCAEWTASALRSGDLTVVSGDTLTNGRDFINRKDCWVVYQDGTRRADRYRNDGTVCREGCSKSPEPCASPTPVPPSPSPKPSPSSSPPPNDDACTMGADGNYPTPPDGVCPACWREDPNLIQYWGIAFRSKTPCSGPNCPYGIKINVDITPHSAKPYLRHRAAAGGSETWTPCQPCGDPGNPECRAAIPSIWVYPRGAEAGLCDPFSGSLFWCHHKPQAGQDRPTKFEVRQPPFKSIIVNVP